MRYPYAVMWDGFRRSNVAGCVSSRHKTKAAATEAATRANRRFRNSPYGRNALAGYEPVALMGDRDLPRAHLLQETDIERIDIPEWD